MAMIVMKRGLKSAYNALVEKNPDALYFIEDTGEIFLGNINLSQVNTHFTVDNYESLPTSAKAGDIATISSAIGGTGKVSVVNYIYTGTEWKIISGSENATNVLFTEDIGDLSTSNKSVVDVIKLVAKDANDKITNIEETFESYKTTHGLELDAVEADVATLKTEVQGLEDTSATKVEVDAYKTSNDARVKAVEDSIDIINGDESVEGSVKKTVNTAIAEIIAEAPEAFDTLKEVADYISGDQTKAVEIENSIDNLNKQLDGLEDTTGSVKGYVDDSIEAEASARSTAISNLDDKLSNKCSEIEVNVSNLDSKIDDEISTLQTTVDNNDRANVSDHETFRQDISEVDTKIDDYVESNDARAEVIEASIAWNDLD